MDYSHYMKSAKAEIAKVRQKTLTAEQRRESAVSLAGTILQEARRIQSNKERRIQGELARMMEDPHGKEFTICMTDQCFRSKQPARVADQLLFNIHKYGIPHYLNLDKKIGLVSFKLFGKLAPQLFVPMTKSMVRREMAAVILPGEEKELRKYLQNRRNEGIRVNLNHLGEAILGEEEAESRLNVYLQDLANPEVEYISVKISTIFSQINLLAWHDSLTILSERLKLLYRAAKQNLYVRPDGAKIPKFVNLDMEEYRDLLLTVSVFQHILEDPEFFDYYAGIVLQSYLPDSYLIQQELTIWAMQRLMRGGAPIKIRIVKGANLAMEQVEASLKGWPQAPYNTKKAVDANFKRMLLYGCQPEHARAAHLGIGSHNLFDIAYGLLLQAENHVEEYVCFEMLEGMADHMRKVVQQLCREMLLYCPAATQDSFQNAVAYLIRRLDENTAPENFLRYAFNLIPGTKEWRNQTAAFTMACHFIDQAGVTPRRTQNRLRPAESPRPCCPFENEPDTDWALPQNRMWAEKIIQEWSAPGKTVYPHPLATPERLNEALESAKKAQADWKNRSAAERSAVLACAAQAFRQHRGELIGAMIGETAKTVPEGDVEVSEAIDFIEYYRRNAEEWFSLTDISWEPKGAVVVASPWNFPCSIPVGGISAALAAGNSVIFKPPPEAVFVGWLIAQIFWEAGLSPGLLQLIVCADEPIGSLLIQDPRVDSVILTGATDTAKHLLGLRPGLDLSAETGGKNTLIITAMADRDLAIKDLIQSAFGHAGQKCSACSLAILEAEIYDDPDFQYHLKDAAASLKTGSPWNLAVKVNPLIRPPSPQLLRGLTTLDEGEEWLLKPVQDPSNPNLWSPGIKRGVKEGSFTHQTELFGPVLGLMRAENLEHALKIANGTPYGLTAGLHSLDTREQHLWLQQIEAGNCYVNRGITGAVVQRQPFGGCKASSFGRGAKAGGPNYLTQLMTPHPHGLAKESAETPQAIAGLCPHLTAEQRLVWQSSIGSYAFYWTHYFSKDHDPSLIQGQDNIFRYAPLKNFVLRVQNGDDPLSVFLALAAAAICSCPLTLSAAQETMQQLKTEEWLPRVKNVQIQIQDDPAFIQSMHRQPTHPLRLLSPPSPLIQEACAKQGCYLNARPVVSNGRLELLNFLREISISIDYHRYGNLGEREYEKRKPIL